VALSPEAQTWLSESFPVGNFDDTPREAVARMKWDTVKTLARGTVVLAESPRRLQYRVTQTDTGPRAQRTT